VHEVGLRLYCLEFDSTPKVDVAMQFQPSYSCLEKVCWLNGDFGRSSHVEL
jgi:hypothetical protein